MSVSVAPTSATLATGASRTFTATVTGAADPSVTWSATCGAVAGSGATVTYSAPGTAGTCTVRATSVEAPARSGTATVTVTSGGVVGWTRQVASAGDEEVTAVAVAPDGTVFAAGRTDGALPGQTNLGVADAFVVAFSADGDLLWSRQFGSADSDEVTAIAVRSDGDVVAVGFTLASPFVGAVGAQDAFAVRLAAADGATVWGRQLGTVSDDAAYAVALAADGDVYVGGDTVGNFAGFTLSGVRDAYLARLDGATGTVEDVVQFGSSGIDDVRAIAVLEGGDVVVGGRTGAVMPGSGLATPVGDVDGYLRRFTPAFGASQTAQFGVASRNVSVLAMALAPDGDLRIAGDTSGALTAEPHAGSRDVFAARADASTLARSWTVQAGSADTDTAQDLAVDADGVAFLVGSTAGAFAGPIDGTERAIVLRVGADGGGVEREQFGEGANTYANAVAIAGTGFLAIGGWTNGAIDGFVPQGESDGYVVKRPY